VKDRLTTVSGTDTKGKPFAVRLRQCADMDGVDAFADECDGLRTNPRKSGDLLLLRPSDA